MYGTSYEIIDFNPFNSTNVRIFLPIEYLSLNSSIYSISSYKYYPMINSNLANNFSDITVSLKMFDDKLSNIPVSNSKYPIGFLFTKSSKDLGSCIFLDESNK